MLCVVCCLSFVVWCLLFGGLLFVVCCLMFDVCCELFGVVGGDVVVGIVDVVSVCVCVRVCLVLCLLCLFWFCVSCRVLGSLVHDSGGRGPSVVRPA